MPRFIEVSHVIEPGMVTYPGLPAPEAQPPIQGGAEFDKGAAKKYVIDPNGMIPAA